MQQSLSPRATSSQLLDALSFIQCKLTAIIPALLKAYRFFFCGWHVLSDRCWFNFTVRLSARARGNCLKKIWRKSHENHAACDGQRPLAARTQLQGQSVVPWSPSAFVGVHAGMCVDMKMCAFSLNKRTHPAIFQCNFTVQKQTPAW